MSGAAAGGAAVGLMSDLDAIEAAGITVIQDRSPKIEYQRLFGEVRQGGFNTRILSSRL
jgi:hypothetical protein